MHDSSRRVSYQGPNCRVKQGGIEAYQWSMLVYWLCACAVFVYCMTLAIIEPKGILSAENTRVPLTIGIEQNSDGIEGGADRSWWRPDITVDKLHPRERPLDWQWKCGLLLLTHIIVLGFVYKLSPTDVISTGVLMSSSSDFTPGIKQTCLSGVGLCVAGSSVQMATGTEWTKFIRPTCNV